MTEYVIMDLATKTEQLTQKIDALQETLSKLLDGVDQLAELTEDIRNHITAR